MTQVWIYSLSSSSDPDKVDCRVPWLVNKDLIFFGPCKTRIRKKLRDQYLNEDYVYREVTDNLFIVGINGSNDAKTRKVVWAGKLSRVMTFAEAFRRLKERRFKKLRDDECSPLHVRPVMGGYAHRSKLHRENQDWIYDFVSPRRESSFRIKCGRIVLRHAVSPEEPFDRDCCMLLENRFFAQGQGIAFDNEALAILKAAQPDESGIDDYAVFGRTANRQANGLRGSYLQIDGELANRFVKWLEGRSRKGAKQPRGNGTERVNIPSTSHRLVRRRQGLC
jgi:hypothetical protein